jgi:hypothetical protein
VHRRRLTCLTSAPAGALARTIVRTLVASLAVLPVAACTAGEPRSVEAGGEGAGSTAGAPAHADGCAAEGGRVVTGQGVGPVRIGVAAGDLAARCPTRDTAFSLGEGLVERGRVVALGTATVVAVATGADTTGADTVSRVIAADPSLRTDRGVGVGSTVGELRRAYGRLCGAVGEGTVVVAAADLPGLSFVTSTSYSVAARRAELARDARAIPDTARVTSLIVHGSRAPCAPG